VVGPRAREARRRLHIATTVCAVLFACAAETARDLEAEPPFVLERPFVLELPFVWELPLGFPIPPIPAENPMSEAKVTLGRRLFYDTRLSQSGRDSCASCHRQELAFTDGRPRAIGATGEEHRRGAPSLANIAYRASLGWGDPELHPLEAQVEIPMFNTEPVELGVDAERAVALFRDDPLYAILFAAAFPGEREPFSIEHAARAIACFERTLLSGNSPYDRLLFLDERDAFPSQAWRGMRLFFSEALRCADCHSGLLFAGAVASAERRRPVPEFHNIGLYALDARGSYPARDPGLVAHTGRAEDQGRFRTPSLRNVALTAPYMHDGSVPTLEAVIDLYAAGGRTIAAGPYRGDGRANPHKSAELTGFAISAEQKRDLLAFLATLTDAGFVNDPRFSDPWRLKDD